ncbi:hypothetical protein TorRG33x02_229220 [Trema orientale]|uniref:Transmembrane protein n=1 Tax=Trema orientale TaxID=63057 RepID=A0A2P5E732_TREOI|nr:hypothetical protein TorRG33x02_229220 [Trema orientale]
MFSLCALLLAFDVGGGLRWLLSSYLGLMFSSCSYFENSCILWLSVCMWFEKFKLLVNLVFQCGKTRFCKMSWGIEVLSRCSYYRSRVLSVLTVYFSLEAFTWLLHSYIDLLFPSVLITCLFLGYILAVVFGSLISGGWFSDSSISGHHFFRRGILTI